MDLDKQFTSHKLKIFTESGIREALIRYAESSCCFGKNPALKMDILRIRMSQAYRYHSEAFTETRKLKWQTIPYTRKHKDAFVDGPENGTQLLLWGPKISPPNGDFIDSEIAFEMPHTATISNCADCEHSGFTPCHFCSPPPSGRDVGASSSTTDTTRNNAPYKIQRPKCPRCSGTGFITEHIGQGQSRQHKCFHCGGNCNVCLGEGQVPCRRCLGSGLLKSFQQLEVKWQNISEWNAIMKPEVARGLQPKHLKLVTGELIVCETNGSAPNVNQLDAFPDSEVKLASVKAFDKFRAMSTSISNMRILKVRQSVITILVAEVDALWDQQLEMFYVYGNERCVHFPKGYPQNCLRLFKLPFNLF